MFKKKQQPSGAELLEEIEARQKRDLPEPEKESSTYPTPFDFTNDTPYQPWVYPDEYKATEPVRERQISCHFYGVSVGGDALGEDTLTAVSLPLSSLCAVLEAPLGKVECSLTVQTHTHSIKLEGKRLDALHYELSEHKIGVVRKYQPERCILPPNNTAPIITKITLEN